MLSIRSKSIPIHTYKFWKIIYNESNIFAINLLYWLLIINEIFPAISDIYSNIGYANFGILSYKVFAVLDFAYYEIHVHEIEVNGLGNYILKTHIIFPV